MQETAVVSPTPEAPAATPAMQEPASVSTGTAEPQRSDAAGAAPSEETFFSGDPNTLPPELQQAYKNMLKDYKQKTQNVAETRKKAEQFDKIASRPDFKDWMSGMNRQQKAEFQEQKAVAEKKLGEKISDEDFAKAFNSKDEFLSLLERVVQDRSEKAQKKIETLEQKLSVKEAQDFVESFATESGKDGKPVRPDFYALDEDNLITGYLRLAIDPSKGLSSEDYRSKLDEAYQFAKTVTAKYYEKGKSEALQIIQAKAAASSQPPTNAAKGAYDGPDPKKLTVREAFEYAKKGKVVPRDD